MAMTTDPALNRAILHLLVQVAWADHEVSEAEIAHIVTMAQRAQLDAEEIESLRACLAGGQELPTPDMGLLRDHKKEVFLAIGALMTSDDNIDSDERELFDQIKELLG